MLQLVLITSTLVLIYKTLVFMFSLWFKRNDIADVSWGVSFILILLTTLSYSRNFSPSMLLVSLLVIVWGVRLAVRIFLRNKNKKEDFRYQKLRQESGTHFLLVSFLKVYILQGFLAVVVSAPVLIIGYYSESLALGFLFYLGLVVWMIGFFFEVVADYQLDKFLANSMNRGHVLQTGLWRYSRHPNYFGEILMWWGIFLIALSVPNGYLSLIGPVTITLLITKVSGIPLLEKKYNGNQEFENYKKRTSVLIPLLTK